MKRNLTITLDGDILFDRKVSEVDIAQDIHGNLTASAKFDAITPDFPELLTGQAADGAIKLVTASTSL